MATREQLTFERVQTLLERLIPEDGASAPGQVPPARYVAALGMTRELGAADAIANAHAEGEMPPTPDGITLEEQRQERQSTAHSTVSDASKRAFCDARESGDVQAQLDVLFEIITNERPAVSTDH